MEAPTAVQGGELVDQTPPVCMSPTLLNTLLMKRSTLPRSFKFEGYEDSFLPPPPFFLTATEKIMWAHNPNITSGQQEARGEKSIPAMAHR